MYQVDRSANRILKLTERRFADLNIREREHLQEWLADTPEALGEELLIIQKEFDGFEGTRERLDLLALDKSGQLVIIENKLDDAGRDVTWQALKYTAYASRLKTMQIVEIYQRYLDRQSRNDNASDLICEFMEAEEISEIVLNKGNDQRLFFVAANFRKEVTSTVLWLREHSIDARCFRVAPFSHGDDLFIDIQPVIPTPEAADFMIGMAEKENEARGAQGELKARHKMRLDYWNAALDALREAGDSLYSNISPNKDHWLNASSGLRACHYCLIFAKSEIRVEFVFARANKEENKLLFDLLLGMKQAIEDRFGEPFLWLRLDNKKSSRIQFSLSCDGYDRDSWPMYIEWHVEKIGKLEEAIRPSLPSLIAAIQK